MDSEASEIRERAWVEHRSAAITRTDTEMWVAEDPETECLAMGRVEAEAMGNLVSVVGEFESDPTSDDPLLKLPGEVVDRPTVDGSDSLLDAVRSLF